MATLSPVLPEAHGSYQYRQESHSYPTYGGSSRYPPMPSYSSYPSPPQESRPSPTQGVRLPSLRSMQVLPPISTFDSARLSLPTAISPYEQYQSHSPSLAYSGPRSPYSTQSIGPTTIPSPISDTHRPVSKKGPWTKAEDEMLVFHVQQQQQSNLAHATHWGDVSKLMGELRTAKQCRERYTQNLAPGLNRQPITDREAAFIREWVEKNGTQWAELSRQPQVRGRSDNHLKNWWNGQRKQLEDRDRAVRKANIRRSSHQSTSQRTSSSPASSVQRALPTFPQVITNVSPVQTEQRSLPPPVQTGSPTGFGQRMNMASILN
jgi:hypothetical protein